MSKRFLGYNFSLLHADYVKLNSKWNYTNVISPYFRIYYIDEGEGYVSSRQEKIKLEQGYLYIIPSFTLCDLRCNEYLSQYFLHFFEESAEGISLFEYNRKIIKVPAGGLVLFYNNSSYSGILANKESILANLRGWQFETEKNVIKRHVFLKLKNINNTVDMFYSLDGIKWNKIESSLEISSINHNALGGFLSVRIGLCSMGEGIVRFKNFTYKPIR